MAGSPTPPQLTGDQIVTIAQLNASVADIGSITKAISDVLVSPNASELGHYIASCISAANAPINYMPTQLPPVPRGAQLRFWLANTDDSATVRCESLMFSVGRGQAPQVEMVTLNMPGPNVILVELDNSSGGAYGITLHVDVQQVAAPAKPGRYITVELSPTGLSDPIFQSHRRNFIYRFTVL
jgi:hypothetical protein